jgi:hypothetical protein
MTAHSAAELLRALNVPGNVPTTDSVDALFELGFIRAYPQLREGHEAKVWERDVDGGSVSTPYGLRRQFARQRAILSAPRAHGR